MRLGSALAAILLLVGIPAHGGDELTITHVRHAPAFFEVAEGGTATVFFHVSTEAGVMVRLFDARDRLVRELAPESPLAAGHHRVVWDGRDAAGRPVPPSVYRYVIEGRPPGGGEAVVHDWTDLARRRPFELRDLRWDADASAVRYGLPFRGWVRIRAWLEDGPMLATIVDWVPRPEGANQEPWKGPEALDLPDALRARFQLVGHAFTLAPNAIGVLPRTRAPRWIEDLPWGEEIRETRRAPPERQRDPLHQPAAQRGDHGLVLEVPGAAADGAGGLVVDPGPVRLRVDAPPANAPRLLAERFGVEIYVDGALRFETERGYIPLTWIWNASEAQGTHLVTANVFGYDGNMGAVSRWIRVGARAE